MPLVNALQHNSSEVFNYVSESPSRFAKIKSLWSFQVKNQGEGNSTDVGPSQPDVGDSGPPSSFIT